MRFAAPLARTREYVDIVRAALARQTVAFEGEHFRLPLPDGPGKALKLTVAPSRGPIPIYLAAVGPKNLQLAGEVADGWLAVFFAPEFAAEQLAQIEAGGPGRPDRGRASTSWRACRSASGRDPRRCADPVRPYAALYLGGMGSRQANFYNALAVRMGFDEAAATVQDLYLSRRHRDAMAAVPYEFIDATSLLGDRGSGWRSGWPRSLPAGVTTVRALAPVRRQPVEEKLARPDDVAAEALRRWPVVA